MQIHAVARVHVQASPEEAFDAANDESKFAERMQKKGIFPGVTGVEPAGEGKRRVFLSDGSTMIEEILERRRPERVRYRWDSKPKPPFSWLIRDAEAIWTFSARAGGTDVEWRYVFELTTALVYPLAAPVLLGFRGWMQTALDRVAASPR
jgi:hypothetical protein